MYMYLHIYLIYFKILAEFLKKFGENQNSKKDLWKAKC